MLDPIDKTFVILITAFLAAVTLCVVAWAGVAAVKAAHPSPCKPCECSRKAPAAEVLEPVPDAFDVLKLTEVQ